MGTLRYMTTQTTHSTWGEAFPEFGPGDRIRLIRRRMLGDLTQGQLADALGVKRESVSAWEAGRNEGGITSAVALRLEMLTGQPGTAAFVLGVLPVTGPDGGAGVHKPHGLWIRPTLALVDATAA